MSLGFCMPKFSVAAFQGGSIDTSFSSAEIITQFAVSDLNFTSRRIHYLEKKWKYRTAVWCFSLFYLVLFILYTSLLPSCLQHGMRLPTRSRWTNILSPHESSTSPGQEHWNTTVLSTHCHVLLLMFQFLLKVDEQLMKLMMVQLTNVNTSCRSNRGWAIVFDLVHGKPYFQDLSEEFYNCRSFHLIAILA